MKKIKSLFIVDHTKGETIPIGWMILFGIFIIVSGYLMQ